MIQLRKTKIYATETGHGPGAPSGTPGPGDMYRFALLAKNMQLNKVRDYTQSYM